MAAGSRRRRLLPAWMGAAGDERAAAAAPLPRTGRRQAAVAPRAAAAVYCMNEAELVDVALEVLAEVRLEPREWGRSPGRTRARPGGREAPERRVWGAAGRRPGFPVPSFPSRRLPGPAQLHLSPPTAPPGSAVQEQPPPGTGKEVPHGNGGLRPTALGCCRGEVAHSRLWWFSRWSESTVRGR
ncbi:cell cycle regulator of non-homologous end joining isoform X1 [Nyctibius grandis]|uniref:cell cycle regulator of non-homologous end joining isoform X1 n=1 Tax=Nyctibius grandis TaxID=48427 RepID=UPI0035BC7AB9